MHSLTLSPIVLVWCGPVAEYKQGNQTCFIDLHWASDFPPVDSTLF